jgi:hypothetical protein
MAIEVSYRQEDGEILADPRLIVPGEYMTYSDFTLNERRVVAVHCLPNDRGGEVYEFDNPGFDENNEYRVVNAAAFGLHSRIAIIRRNRSYERDIVAETREIVHAIFTHRPTDPAEVPPLTPVVLVIP